MHELFTGAPFGRISRSDGGHLITKQYDLEQLHLTTTDRHLMLGARRNDDYVAMFFLPVEFLDMADIDQVAALYAQKSTGFEFALDF